MEEAVGRAGMVGGEGGLEQEGLVGRENAAEVSEQQLGVEADRENERVGCCGHDGSADGGGTGVRT